MLLKKMFCLVCLVFFSLSSVFAEERTTFNLGEIVVSPDDEQVLIAEITSQDMKEKNAHTVAEALDGVQGIFVSVGDKNEPDVKIRGIKQDKILVLIDGFPVAGPYYGYVNLNQIPLENIAKIKVIKGPSSLLYGANALGGVINIITKESVLDSFTSAGLDITQYDTYHCELTHGQKAGRVSFLASGSLRKSDGFALSDSFEETANEDGGRRENSDYERKALSLKLGIEPADGQRFTVSLNYIDNEEGLPYSTTSSSPRYWRFSEWKKWNLAFMEQVKLTPEVSVRGRLFYDKYDNVLESYDDASFSTQTGSYAFTSTYDDYGVGGSIHPTVSCGDRHLFRGAVHFKHDVHKEQPDTGEMWENYKADTYSFGLEDEIGLRENLSLVLGGSFDVFDIDERDMDSYGFYLRTQYDAGEYNQYWVALSQKGRFPTLHQLYSSYSGNLNLKEEEALSSELGIRRLLNENMVATVTLFATEIDDLIEREGKREPYLNISKANLDGIETGLEIFLNESNRICLGYTYISAEEETDSTERELPYVPEQEAYIRFRGNNNSGLSYYLGASYVGERYWYDDDIQQELGSYWLLNARLSQQIGNGSEVFISIDNLLDEDYEEEDGGFPQPGRTIWIGIKNEF